MIDYAPVDSNPALLIKRSATSSSRSFRARTSARCSGATATASATACSPTSRSSPRRAAGRAPLRWMRHGQDRVACEPRVGLGARPSRSSGSSRERGGEVRLRDRGRARRARGCRRADRRRRGRRLDRLAPPRSPRAPASRWRASRSGRPTTSRASLELPEEIRESSVPGSLPRGTRTRRIELGTEWDEGGEVRSSTSPASACQPAAAQARERA